MARTRFSGPIKSSGGFEIGTGVTNTEVIGSDGKFKLADGVATEQMNPSYMKVVKLALSPGDADEFAFVWQNPESTKIIVHRLIVRTTTAGGTGSSVLDVGPCATATATADTLIDGANLNDTATYDNLDGINNAVNNGIVDEKGGTNDHITGKILVANAAALAGSVYIYYTAV